MNADIRLQMDALGLESEYSSDEEAGARGFLYYTYRKEMTMSKQFKHENPQVGIEASKQAIAELSNEQLEEVAGGIAVLPGGPFSHWVQSRGPVVKRSTVHTSGGSLPVTRFADGSVIVGSML
jgi:hypothetical protein